VWEGGIVPAAGARGVDDVIAWAGDDDSGPEAGLSTESVDNRDQEPWLLAVESV
jgi:hypothetical protein